MKKDVLLLVLVSLFLAIGFGCNGAGLDSPSSNPLPGSGADNPGYDDKIDSNYAIDILPQREIPPSIPVEDPEWDPVFDCLTETPTCIDEGCVQFEVNNLDRYNLKVDFDVTFFNWNAEDFDKLTVFLVITDTSLGVTPFEPDGTIKLDEFDTVEFPYYAFNNENNPGDNDVPGTMYCYFERVISFKLKYGCDFYASYLLVPVVDQHDLSYKIDLPGRTINPGVGGGGEGERDGENYGNHEAPEPGSPGGDSGSESGGGSDTTPKLRKPGN